MDVAELSGHVFTGDQITGIGRALTPAGRLGIDNDPVALGGGIDRTTEDALAIDAHGCGAPAGM